MAHPQLDGQTVLLTGAAGGLGKGIARKLYACGARVILSGRSAKTLETLQEELGSRAEVLTGDLAEEGQATELAERAGPVDILIANAALPGSGPLISLSDDLPSYTLPQADRVLTVNLRAPIHLTHALLPGMLQRGHGKLIYISSLAGKTPTVGAPMYSATKFGLRGFTLAMREDLRGTGVGVTTIYPGLVTGAGMLQDTGVELGRSEWVGLAKPKQVTAAVLKAIEKNKAEIVVAPFPQRFGAALSGFAPGFVAGVMRRGGAEEISRKMAVKQRNTRGPD